MTEPESTPPPEPAPTSSAGKFIKSLSQAEKIILGCCVLVALLCFLPWYTVSMPKELKAFAGNTGSANAFDAWQGVLTFLLALATAGALWADKTGAVTFEPRVAKLVPLAGCALATLFTLIYLASAKSQEVMGMKAGTTLWPIAALLAMGAATFFAFTRLKTSPPPPSE